MALTKVYTWTPTTELGHLNRELETIIAFVNAIGAVVNGTTGDVTAARVGVNGAVPGAIVGGQSAVLNVTGYSGLGGLRVNGTDGLNTFWQANAATALAITTSGGDLKLGAATSTAHLIISGSSASIGLWGTSFGGGTQVLFIGNRAVAPSSNPTGGGLLYAESGALKYRGSSGTVTTIAPA